VVRTPAAQQLRDSIDKWDFIKLKSFCSSKEMISKLKRTPTEHKIKASAHKGGVRIGKTPKKLATICCPQCGETKADTLKATEANRRRDQELEKRLDQEELTEDSKMAARGRKQKASLL
jgi:hypothetical protein